MRASIFDLQGRQVRGLESLLPAGVGGLHWDGRDEHGQAVTAGMYLYRLEGRGGEQEGRLLIVR